MLQKHLIKSIGSILDSCSRFNNLYAEERKKPLVVNPYMNCWVNQSAQTDQTSIAYNDGEVFCMSYTPLRGRRVIQNGDKSSQVNFIYYVYLINPSED